jgi:hypothetical protein
MYCVVLCCTVQAASTCDVKRVAAVDGKLRLLAAEVDRLDGQAATAALQLLEAQVWTQHSVQCT